MLKKAILTGVVSTLFIFSLKSFSITTEGVEFKPERKVFKKGEKVCFTLKNKSGRDIYLPSSAPWAVFEDNDMDKVIYSPVATQKIEKLEPYQSKKWCWDQKTFDNDEVTSGDYKIRITVFKNGKRLFLAENIKIQPEYTAKKETKEEK
ncbi:MAG: hypothetical protein GXO21_00915 [Aquificae bacterium]|nr:hypothetical protein [Aquificota bacterium]